MPFSSFLPVFHKDSASIVSKRQMFILAFGFFITVTAAIWFETPSRVWKPCFQLVLLVAPDTGATDMIRKSSFPSQLRTRIFWSSLCVDLTSLYVYLFIHLFSLFNVLQWLQLFDKCKSGGVYDSLVSRDHESLKLNQGHSSCSLFAFEHVLC